MPAPPLQVIDSFLYTLNVGDVVLLLTVLGVLGLLIRRSGTLIGGHLVAMGLLLLVLPMGMLEPKTASLLETGPAYKFVGIALVVVAPPIVAISRR